MHRKQFVPVVFEVLPKLRNNTLSFSLSLSLSLSIYDQCNVNGFRPLRQFKEKIV